MQESTDFNGEALELIRDTNVPEAKSMLDRVLVLTNTHTNEVSKRELGAMVQPKIVKTRFALRHIF